MQLDPNTAAVLNNLITYVAAPLVTYFIGLFTEKPGGKKPGGQ